MLRRCAVELLINMLSSEEKSFYEKEFNKFDTTKRGVITQKEFVDKIKDTDPHLNPKEIK